MAEMFKIERKPSSIAADHFEAGNSDEAISVLKTAGKKGDVMACVDLGTCYMLGVGVKKSEKDGMKWWNKALQARRKDPEWWDHSTSCSTCFDSDNFNMSGKHIESEDAACIANALIMNKCFSTVTLDTNSISNGGAVALGEVLRVNDTITTLSLIGNEIGPEGCTALAKSLGENSSLTSLNLNFNPIGSEGAKELFSVLCTNSVLLSLSLFGTSIGPEGAAEFVKVIQNNQSLTNIDIGGNRLLEEIGNIGAALKKNSSLTSACFSLSELGARGARALADALEFNTSLLDLDIAGNGIGDLGISEISNALRKNTTLTRISFRRNQIGDPGVFALADAMKVNSSITEVNLRTNNITPAVERSFRSSFDEGDRDVSIFTDPDLSDEE